MAVTKAVLPVAGLGTRFLPATKAIPKEMLPIVDAPAVQYVVEEAASAGLTDVLFISGKDKTAIIEHFDAVPALEHVLEAKGDLRHLEAVRHPQGLANIHSIRQGDPRGLGHAVLRAKGHVGDEPFAVMLGDDLIDPGDPLLATMLKVRERLGGSVIALLEVPHENISMYGSVAVGPGPAEVARELGMAPDDFYRVDSLVEKPTPEQAPSDLAVIGRYVLDPAVFGVLERTPPGRGGEIQLTDALATLATMPSEAGGGVHGIVFRGHRYDTGDRLDYLKAVVEIACGRADLGPDFSAWLRDFAHRTQDSLE
jgi:UTP--glucose-1-phosphate uridylyltransferase